jgi:hypothetical protein
MAEAGTFDSLGRPTREEDDSFLFDVGDDWRSEWWGMPAFEAKDARPRYKITVNFMTAEDVAAFAKAVDAKVTARSDSMWFPHQEPLNGAYSWDGPPTDSKYPVCIPSKGRAKHQKTAGLLDRMGVSYRVFVEETEAEAYYAALPQGKVVVMPFHDLGKGSIPARNFIWEWCKEREHKRHWTVDDNITTFTRCHMNRRLCVRGGGYFRAIEDFVDRYENVAMAGPHDQAFVMDRDPNLTPYLLNSRVYSCILLDTTLPDRWRGRYNEDTDLSLRLLKQGYVTVLFRALCMNKAGTSAGADGRGGTPGGNTDNVYNGGDFRREFAESLKAQHPDVVEVTWKFGRWHHQVDYSPFRRNKLKRKAGIVPGKHDDDYGMELKRAEKGARK